MRRLLTGLLGLALLGGACSGDDDDSGAAVTSIPEQTTTSSTTTEPPVPPIDVIPQDVSLITEEYVENVLDALYESMLGATVAARDAGIVEERAIAISEATNTQESSVEMINGLIAQASEGFSGLRAQLRPVDVTVVKVHEATDECIFAEATFDFSGLTEAPGNASDFRLFARLEAATEAQRSSGLNPTAWALDELPATQDDTVPEGQCSSV